MGSGRGANRRAQSKVPDGPWNETRQIGETTLFVAEVAASTIPDRRSPEGSYYLRQRIIAGHVEVHKSIGKDGDYGDVTLTGHSFAPLQFLDLELQDSLHAAAASSDTIVSLNDLSGQKTYYFDGCSDPEGIVLRCLNSDPNQGSAALDIARAELYKARNDEEKIAALQKLEEFSDYLCTIEKTTARSIGSGLLVMRNNAERYGNLLAERANPEPARVENVDVIAF